MNVNDPWKYYRNFIGHPYLKILYPQSAHGASHHAWTPGPPPSKSGAVRA